MTPTAPQPATTAFFLPGPSGGRFCLYHPPAAGIEVRGAFVYIHPFAEELNCARRMAALQARRLVACGFGVLQIDLTGCGDSCGELKDARWEAWRHDVADAARWLADHCSPSISLWGLRLGALLALDSVACLDVHPAHMLLWQPVLSGHTSLTQFLRLALARQISTTEAPRHADTKAMRAALASGETLEIAGYELSGALASDLDAVDATQIRLPALRVHWLEMATTAHTVSAASQRVIDAWQARGGQIDTAVLDMPAFWSVPGHIESTALIDASLGLMIGETV